MRCIDVFALGLFIYVVFNILCCVCHVSAIVGKTVAIALFFDIDYRHCKKKFNVL